MTISLVVCTDINNGIGFENKLLVKIKEDMEYFKQITTSGSHNIILMGRKTHESIGKILTNRINVVLTTNKNYKTLKSCVIYNSLEKVLKEYRNYGNGKVSLWVVGGENIYNQLLPYADKIYLTLINYNFNNVDSYFPKISLNEWDITKKSNLKLDKETNLNYRFIEYERKIS